MALVPDRDEPGRSGTGGEDAGEDALSLLGWDDVVGVAWCAARAGERVGGADQ
jgi:hypothetical protein